MLNLPGPVGSRPERVSVGVCSYVSPWMHQVSDAPVDNFLFVSDCDAAAGGQRQKRERVVLSANTL